MKVWVLSWERYSREVHSFFSCTMNGCGIDPKWAQGQQIHRNIGHTCPLVADNLRPKVNGQQGPHRVPNAIELQDQVVASWGQLNFQVLLPWPGNKHLHHLKLPQAIGRTHRARWWRWLPVERGGDPQLNTGLSVQYVNRDPMLWSHGATMPLGLDS
jgi:hypothetical protein